MKIDVVSDISCPWCFVAKARLRRALARRSVASATAACRLDTGCTS